MNNHSVFVDTGAWIACMDKGDVYHNSAVSYLNEIRKKNIPLITSNYVIDETLTWLNYHNLHKKALTAMELWKEAEQDKLLKIYWIDDGISKKAWEIYCNFSDQKLSFTDCTSFAICKELGVQKVFGFDKHFNVLGFLLSPYQVHEDKMGYEVLQPANQECSGGRSFLLKS
ncbi:MAG: type II toxin-antitoxin system VapC family toxin [Bacillota bacterium]